MVGSTTCHDLVTLATLSGLGAELVARKGVVRALAEDRPTAASAGTWAADLFSTEVNLFRKRPLLWVMSDGRYVLPLGDGFLAMEAQRYTWTVLRHPRVGASEVVAEGLSLDWAMGTAEDLARQIGIAVFIDPNAPWRERPPSEKQLACLASMGIRVDPQYHPRRGGGPDHARMARRRSA